MSETISYANEARKQVGKYLVEQCGYAKRTATRFIKTVTRFYHTAISRKAEESRRWK